MRAAQVREELKSRGLSVATPGVTGSQRTEMLEKRLNDAIAKEIRQAWSAQQVGTAVRTTAFKEFRCEMVRDRVVDCSVLMRTCLCMRSDDYVCPCTYALTYAFASLRWLRWLPGDADVCVVQASRRLDIAVYKCDYTSMMRAIANGASVNMVCRGGRTPLLNAVEQGSVEAVMMLHKAGALLNQKVGTPLPLPLTQLVLAAAPPLDVAFTYPHTTLITLTVTLTLALTLTLTLTLSLKLALTLTPVPSGMLSEW